MTKYTQAALLLGLALFGWAGVRSDGWWGYWLQALLFSFSAVVSAVDAYRHRLYQSRVDHRVSMWLPRDQAQEYLGLNRPYWKRIG